ncbi:nucleotidyltransferase domain-containing protein [Billgrantia azerbaijanica]|nr:nucleotidyltransferase domain-containing protein [Halomonas azerbaijanica]
MRLTPQQQTVIKSVLKRHFGDASAIRLFGSRVDDAAKGGDIDLYIEPEIQEPDRLVDAKLKALVELRRELGDQKIDLVIRRREAPALPIYRVARETGTPL